ncbi:MAG: CRTAC1 family protein [Gammaproteobacteria bacterium]|nr:CRTAC1 family protein [Gammaproteobacteria bacterium]
MATNDRDAERLTRAVKGSAITVGILIVIAVCIFFLSQCERGETKVVEAPVPTIVVPTADATVPTFNFTDITHAAGIEFVHENGATGDRLLPETMGGGVALFDFDLDGDLDLLFVDSSTWPDEERDTGRSGKSVLYENDGFAQFTNVSDSHLDLSVYGMAPAIGDINGDGYPDLFVTAVGSNRLFLNQEGKRFVNVTESYGVGGDPDAFSSCATFLDYDRDDDLDLFVCNYVSWSVEIDRAVDFQLTGVGRAYGPPTDFPGTSSTLYRNDGDSFTDVTDSAGISVLNKQTGELVGKALAVSVIDVNHDGWSDLIVANDTVRNFLFINQLDGSFAERGVEYGLAFDSSGAATGAMGLDAAHYANDERLGVAIGNFANEMSSFYVNSPGADIFSDDAIVLGIGALTRKVLTFGLFFIDVDNDARLDLFSVNGHIEPEISMVQASQSYEQAPQLFWNCGSSCARPFQPVSTNGTALESPSVGRGATFGDLDADGDIDIVITNIGGKPSILRNDLENSHHWLNVRLTYQNSNQYGIGAVIRVTSEGVSQTRQITRTRSYFSQFDASAHFGLGQSSTVDVVRVSWPNGEETVFRELDANQDVTLEYPVIRPAE